MDYIISRSGIRQLRSVKLKSHPEKQGGFNLVLGVSVFR
jgi:hypothetical protein